MRPTLVKERFVCLVGSLLTQRLFFPINPYPTPANTHRASGESEFFFPSLVSISHGLVPQTEPLDFQQRSQVEGEAWQERGE